MKYTKHDDAIALNAKYDSIWRLLGAYIVFMLCSTALAGLKTWGRDFSTPEILYFTIQWRQVILLPVFVLAYRLFFGPLLPRLKEVWGQRWIQLPGALIVAGVLWCILWVIQTVVFFDAGDSQRVTQAPLLRLLQLPLTVAFEAFFVYGALYRVFVRFRMFITLLAVSLITAFPYVVFAFAVDKVDYPVPHGTLSYVIPGILLVAGTCWGLYIYKRYNSLTPAAMLAIFTGTVTVVQGLMH